MNLYIGEFPAPFKGVSVKNSLLYTEVFSKHNVKILDLAECKRQPWHIPFVFLKLIFELIVAENVLIGVGTDKRRKIILGLQRILRGKKRLKNITLVAMGGRLHLSAQQDRLFLNQLKEVGNILVETNGIESGLKILGITNTKVIPNCRTLKGEQAPRMVNDKVKFVYFSVVCAEKGMDDIVEAVENIKEGYTLDIYGEIVERYKAKFLEFLNNHPEVKYHGVFDSTTEKVYSELNQYDVMLFPTHWKGEGVPGTLVESKISGITAIVSDWNFNKEVVIDGIEGIVSDNLINAMQKLIDDKNLLMQLKTNAYRSRFRYSTKTYEEQLLSCIERRVV